MCKHYTKWRINTCKMTTWLIALLRERYSALSHPSQTRATMISVRKEYFRSHPIQSDVDQSQEHLNSMFLEKDTSEWSQSFPLYSRDRSWSCETPPASELPSSTLQSARLEAPVSRTFFTFFRNVSKLPNQTMTSQKIVHFTDTSVRTSNPVTVGARLS